MRDDDASVYEVPNEEWTPAQARYWEEYCAPVFDRLQTYDGRKWYRLTYRPKQRKQSGYSGVTTRDHVKLGTAEDYVDINVKRPFEPMTSYMGLMMRELGKHRDREDLDIAIQDIVRAKTEVMASESASSLRRVMNDSVAEAKLYTGVPDLGDTDSMDRVHVSIILGYEDSEEMPHPAEILLGEELDDEVYPRNTGVRPRGRT